MPVKLAYYCSGHGYGHATRVSAFASALLSLDDKPEVYIISSTPMRMFSECLNLGAQYRHAEIDPIISQPLAYAVDRRLSFDILRAFLEKKDTKLAEEVEWLRYKEIDCVLSDAAFLACEAATNAHLPSLLITNFTFDSVYSYLGAELCSDPSELDAGVPQVSSGADLHSGHGIEPLVSQLFSGYRNADVLLLLPGFIPIPSFFCRPSLPAEGWINSSSNRFQSNVEHLLQQYPMLEIYPSLTSPITTSGSSLNVHHKKLLREVKMAPLLVRPLSPDVTRLSRRIALLTTIGIPEEVCNDADTRILVVSFGGQTIGRPRGRHGSCAKPPCAAPLNNTNNIQHHAANYRILRRETRESCHANTEQNVGQQHESVPSLKTANTCVPEVNVPAYNLSSSGNLISSPVPSACHSLAEENFAMDDENIAPNSSFEIFPKLVDDCDRSPLPSPSWIAIVCGVPANWSVSETEDGLPSRFYIAPQDVYMPDLTAVADVVLGKLGYGTVSECIAYATPLVYVPRPLFVEEHGLRRFLEAKGVGVELSQQDFESGRWAERVKEAFRKGKDSRYEMRSDLQQEIRELADWVMQWVRNWRGQLAGH
ncbi:hypothetical protein BU17DRAFT_83440 [Hysterangium stoloniferum]|nr:hypothetical protein BU17DRAFT_83440 [Hysterangium stoloniferum]